MCSTKQWHEDWYWNAHNSLFPERCGSSFESVISQHIMDLIHEHNLRDCFQVNAKPLPMLTQICDAIGCPRSRSTLAQVVAWCLMAPRRYHNQYWLIVNEVLWHLLETTFTWSAEGIIPWNLFDKHTCTTTSTVPRYQSVNSLRPSDAYMRR